MSDPPDSDRTPSDGSGRRTGAIPAVRAFIVLVAFVVTVVLTLGVIHPPTTKSASGSVPVTSTTAGSAAHPGTSTTTAPATRVPVLVANASGVSGAAATVSAKLQQVGSWNLLPPVNASTTVPTSHVYYVAGQQQAAEAIASSLHLPPSAVAPYTTAAPIATIGTAEVVVVVGPDLAGSSGTSTTTTARAATSSTVN